MKVVIRRFCWGSYWFYPFLLSSIFFLLSGTKVLTYDMAGRSFRHGGRPNLTVKWFDFSESLDGKLAKWEQWYGTPPL